ncbi:MAG: DUF6079 family protein [Bradymonadia bacterium]
MLIKDAFDIPEITDLDTFITRLDTRDPERIKHDLASFVMVEDVFKQVDKMLHAVGERFEQGLDMGRFIYGSFGSGKSHLMSVLGKMFESDELVYEVGDPLLRELRGRHGWIDRKNLLVVRLNMMGKPSLVRGLYEAYHNALPTGVEPAVMTDHDRVFELIEKDAERLGGLDALIEQLVKDKVVPSKGFFDKMRQGNLSQQLSLAAKLLSWREHGNRRFTPEDMWVQEAEGFARISAHAKANGYDGVVWLVDELIIWIRGKARQEYVREINSLSALVDHDSQHARAVPFFVALAVQQDISATCPEDLSEREFHDQLGFVSNRFQPRIDMADQNLYEVAARRVLKPREGQKEALKSLLDRAFQKHGKTIQTLAGDLPMDLVRRVYPFHPALIRVLVDVTQSLSRSRTSMAALYKLLEMHAGKKVGEFVPVGDLFPIIFDAQNVEGVRDRRSKATELFVEAYDSYVRLQGKIEDVSGKRAHELHQLVRTVLMCQLSYRHAYFPDGRPLAEAITATNLMRLNQSEIKAITERTGISNVIKMFRSLASADPQVQVLGEDTNPYIKIKTQEVDIDAVLGAARADVKHPDRFAVIRTMVDDEFALRLGGQLEVRRKITWQGTDRLIRVRLANVRRLSYAGSTNDFAPASDEEALILVDYPFDEEPGHGRGDDVTTLQNARKRARQWTVAWLPEHLNESERKALENVAAIRRIRQDRERYLAEYSAKMKASLLRTLESYLSVQEAQMRDALKRVYLDEGQVHALSDRLDGVSHQQKDVGKIISSFTAEILEARYPHHPRFRRKAEGKAIRDLATLIIKASVSGASVSASTRELAALEDFAVPLELVQMGQAAFTARQDGRYLSAIKRWIGERQVFSVAELHRFLSEEGDRESYGLTDDVVRLFIWYLVNAEGYAFQREGGEQSVTLDKMADIKLSGVQLAKAEVVPHVAWQRSTEVAEALLGVRDFADVATVPEQSRVSRRVKKQAEDKLRPVQQLQLRLKKACDLLDADVAESARGQTYAALASTLEGFVAEQRDVDRIRTLEAMSGTDQLSQWRALMHPEKGADGIKEEWAALGEIDNLAFQLKIIKQRATEAQKAEVLPPMRNLLLDPITRRLKEHVSAQAKAIRTLADTLIGGNPGPGPDPLKSIKRSGQAQTAQAIIAELQQMIRRSEGERFDFTITLQPVSDEGDAQ